MYIIQGTTYTTVRVIICIIYILQVATYSNKLYKLQRVHNICFYTNQNV